MGLLLASLFAAPTAWAQDVATAEALFNKGVADMGAGKFDTGCPAIGESYRLDPRPGTLFTLAECWAKAGKTASAVARYQDYLELFARLPHDQQQKQHGRDKTAAAQKAALTPEVPTITITLSPDSAPGTVVKRDDVVLGGPSLGLPLPLDPGDHVITAQPPNGPLVTEKVTVAKGEKKTIVLTAKAGEGGEAGGAVAAGPAAPPARRASGGSSQRTAGFVVGGVGAAGIVLGAITGALTLSKKSTITGPDHCNLDTKSCPTAAGKSDISSAQTTGLISTIGFIAGGVGLAGGAVLILTSPKKSETGALAPRVGVGVLELGPRTSFGMTGSF